MAPKANPYKYEALDFPNFRMPAELLKPSHTYWDDLEDIQRQQLQRNQGEIQQEQLRRAKKAAEEEQAQQDFVEANPEKSLDELLPEIEKLRLSQGDFEGALSMRKYGDGQAAKMRDEERDVLSLADRARRSPSMAKLWNDKYGDAYGRIEADPDPAPKSRQGKWETWTNPLTNQQVVVNEADGDEVERVRQRGFYPPKRGSSESFADSLRGMIKPQAGGASVAPAPNALEESNRKLLIRVRPKAQ